MKKIIIDQHYYGSVELPNTLNAWKVFNSVKNSFSKKDSFGLHLLFGKKKLKLLKHYQQGGAWQEILELQLYIAMGEILHFNTEDAQKLLNEIEHINDSAHAHFNISKRLELINKKSPSVTVEKYIFWDIENFANISAMFEHIIDKYDVEDDHIYLAANPDSLYIYKREWESELYDYGKNLYSFNFTKCDHGKNVADDILMGHYKTLDPKNANIYLMTYDRELKERFLALCDESNNLYIMGK